jgi:hypothetical protein
MKPLPPMSSEEVPVHLPIRAGADEPFARIGNTPGGTGVSASTTEAWSTLTVDPRIPSVAWWERYGFASEFDALVAEAKKLLGLP